MTTYLVSRFNPAAYTMRGFDQAEIISHIDGEVLGKVKQGDIFVGVFPLRIAAAICALGGRVMNLRFNLPTDKVGKELSAGEINTLGAVLREYRVVRKVNTVTETTVRCYSDFYLAGLVEWLGDMGYELKAPATKFADGLAATSAGDVVVGAFLPMQAAQIGEKGATFVDFDLTDLPAHLREKQDELGADDIDTLRGRLVAYDVEESVPTDAGLVTGAIA
jgi:putative CRISPR-associated protein (TIGR02620 family)